MIAQAHAEAEPRIVNIGNAPHVGPELARELVQSLTPERLDVESASGTLVAKVVKTFDAPSVRPQNS